jgi:topoisomerase-4 subunit B
MSAACATEKYASWQMRIRMAPTSPRCSAPYSCAFQTTGGAGPRFVAMPPLYRIDAAKDVHYALDEDEKEAVLKRIARKNKSIKTNVQRFKGLGEMNPLQLRETTMATDTRRLIQLRVDSEEETMETMDMMLAKKRSADRKQWLEVEGDLAEIQQ